MNDLTKREIAAIEAVARQFSARWEKGSAASDASIVVGGKRVAVDIATLKQRGSGQGHAATPRLRFDKVATRVIERLKATCNDTVADGTTVLVTLTAPIRVASKTAASIEEKVRTLLGRRSAGRDEKHEVHGNRVQIRLLKGNLARAPKMIGFVHNPDSDPVLLLDMTRRLLELVGVEAGERAPRRAGDRWLVVASAGASSCLEAYRYIYSQLGKATGFSQVLIVFGDGQVGTLAG